MYSQRLLEYFQAPRWVGRLAEPAVTVRVENPVCGDILQLSVAWEGEVVREARFQTKGCTASIAAGAALAEWVTGKTRGELAELTAAVVEAELDGLPNESKHAAVLCVDAVKALLRS
jgi:nitrogen fixation protein NifU and related proteins